MGSNPTPSASGQLVATFDCHETAECGSQPNRGRVAPYRSEVQAVGPFFALFLAGGSVLVEERDRAVVAFAYVHSPTFRAEFDAAHANGSLVVRLASVPPQELLGSGSRGNTAWIDAPRIVRTETHDRYGGSIASRARLSSPLELAARFAHELAHVNELARHGSIRRAPGYRPSRANERLAETEHALAVERQVRAELRAGEQNGGVDAKEVVEALRVGGAHGHGERGRVGDRTAENLGPAAARGFEETADDAAARRRLEHRQLPALVQAHPVPGGR